jgi:hypothetical protein
MVEKFGIGILLALPRRELEADGIWIAKWTRGLIGGLADSLKASANGQALREFCDVISDFMRPLLYGEVSSDVCLGRLQEWQARDLFVAS